MNLHGPGNGNLFEFTVCINVLGATVKAGTFGTLAKFAAGNERYNCDKDLFLQIKLPITQINKYFKMKKRLFMKDLHYTQKKGCTCFVFLFCFFRLAYPFGRPQNEMGKTTVRPLYSPFPLRTESARRIAASSAQPPRASSAAHAAANEFALSSGSRCHCRALRRCFTGCTETISGDDVAS